MHWYQVFYNDVSMFTRGTGVWPSPCLLMVTILVLMCSHWGPIYPTKMIFVVAEIMGWGAAQDIARNHSHRDLPNIAGVGRFTPRFDDLYIYIYLWMFINMSIINWLLWGILQVLGKAANFSMTFPIDQTLISGSLVLAALELKPMVSGQFVSWSGAQMGSTDGSRR